MRLSVARLSSSRARPPSIALGQAVAGLPLAVTIQLNINFFRKAAPRDPVAKGRLLKLGKRLAMGEVTICSDGEAQPVAHLTSTYSIPPPPRYCGTIIPSH